MIRAGTKDGMGSDGLRMESARARARWIKSPSSFNRQSLIVLINNRPAKGAGLRLRKKYEATSRPKCGLMSYPLRSSKIAIRDEELNCTVLYASGKIKING